MTRIAIIGYGEMGTRHFRVMGTMDGAEVVSVRDPNISLQPLMTVYEHLKHLRVEHTHG